MAPHLCPVTSAVISVVGGQVCETMGNGNFSALVEPGHHDVAISAQGYETAYRTVDLSEGDDFSLGVLELMVDQTSMGLGRFSDGGDHSLLTPTSWVRTTNMTISGTRFVLKLEGPRSGGVNTNILPA